MLHQQSVLQQQPVPQQQAAQVSTCAWQPHSSHTVANTVLWLVAILVSDLHLPTID
jgi:hypothetical protein